jgi:dTDP-4-dehydrorhamnose reductase
VKNTLAGDTMREKCILVFGRRGQVASELRNLQWPDWIRLYFFGREEVNVLDDLAVRAALDATSPDIVINTAAYTNVDKAERDADLAYVLNAVVATRLAALTAEMDIPLLHLSTDYVFDGNSVVPYSERDVVAPCSIYGASKAAGESEIRKLTPRHVILRTSWLFGNHGNNFLKTMLRMGAEDSVDVVDDQHGGPTPTLDLAATVREIAVQIILGRENSYGTFHFCGAPETTWYGFAQEIYSAMRQASGRAPEVRKISSHEYKTPAHRPHRSMLNCTKIAATYGIPQPNWRPRVASCVREILSL